MASRATIRTQLATLVRTTGLHAYSAWPANMLGAAAIIAPTSAEHDLTFGLTDYSRYEFDLVVAVAKTPGIVVAQDMLDAYLANTGASSVKAALAADRTLGGNADTVLLGEWSADADENIGGIECLVASLPVRVYAA